jgi:membrane protein YdbS with pleckstrin-like domain
MTLALQIAIIFHIALGIGFAIYLFRQFYRSNILYVAFMCVVLFGIVPLFTVLACEWTESDDEPQVAGGYMVIMLYAVETLALLGYGISLAFF